MFDALKDCSDCLVLIVWTKDEHKVLSADLLVQRRVPRTFCGRAVVVSPRDVDVVTHNGAIFLEKPLGTLGTLGKRAKTLRIRPLSDADGLHYRWRCGARALRLLKRVAAYCSEYP